VPSAICVVVTLFGASPGFGYVPVNAPPAGPVGGPPVPPPFGPAGRTGVSSGRRCGGGVK